MGLPITFTILPITIKDFSCNFIVASLCIVFPYQFYKYGVYFPRKSLHSFTVYAFIFKSCKVLSTKFTNYSLSKLAHQIRRSKYIHLALHRHYFLGLDNSNKVHTDCKFDFSIQLHIGRYSFDSLHLENKPHAHILD